MWNVECGMRNAEIGIKEKDSYERTKGQKRGKLKEFFYINFRD